MLLKLDLSFLRWSNSENSCSSMSKLREFLLLLLCQNSENSYYFFCVRTQRIPITSSVSELREFLLLLLCQSSDNSYYFFCVRTRKIPITSSVSELGKFILLRPCQNSENSYYFFCVRKVLLFLLRDTWLPSFLSDTDPRSFDRGGAYFSKGIWCHWY
jgi:hypothetical protein